MKTHKRCSLIIINVVYWSRAVQCWCQVENFWGLPAAEMPTIDSRINELKQRPKRRAADLESEFFIILLQNISFNMKNASLFRNYKEFILIS